MNLIKKPSLRTGGVYLEWHNVKGDEPVSNTAPKLIKRYPRSTTIDEPLITEQAIEVGSQNQATPKVDLQLTRQPVGKVETFIAKLYPLLYNSLENRGVKDPKMLSSLMVRQLALESAYGTSRFATERHNYGGIGAYDNNPNKAFTYASDQDFVDKYLDLIQNRYPQAWGATNEQDYINGLVSGRYKYFTADPTAYLNSLRNQKSSLKAIETLFA